jgi:hypothetical protein
VSERRFLLQKGDAQPTTVDSRYWYAAKRAVTGRSAFDLSTGELSNEPFEAEAGGVTIRGWVEESSG